MALNITRGRIIRALKVVLYGPEGIGKTSLAACFPGVVFIDTEGSTKSFDVARLPAPTSWEMLKAEVQEVLSHADEVGTLCIDTADWAERLCSQAICEKGKKGGIEDFGYGKGYVYMAEEFGRMLDLCSQLTDRGVNVVFTAHTQQRRVELPDQMDTYDKYELKCSKQISPMLKEWADMVLFCNFKTFVVQSDSKRGKAQGGERKMYAAHRPAFDAKNRFGLPDEMPMDFGQIAHLFPSRQTPPDSAAPVGRPEDSSNAPGRARPAPTQPQAQSPVPAVSAAQEQETQRRESHAPTQNGPSAAEQDARPDLLPPPTGEAIGVRGPAPGIDPFTGQDRLEGIYPPLADLLRTKDINPVDIQDIVYGAGILPNNGEYLEVKDFPEGLCQEIVSKWDSFWKLSEQYCELPF